MNKAYSRINWENYPSDATPINKVNLNRLDSATDILDDRVITLDTTKATKTEVATLVSDVTFEESTGIITITKKNGSRVTIDTQLEKIAVNFDYNPTTEQIVLTLIDGTKQYIDLSALITQYEFLDTDTVAFFVGTDGKVSAIVKEGSIEEKHLEPNYLAKIKVEVAKAETSRADAAASATKAESYAVGGTGSREGEDTDNAQYYYEQVKRVSQGLNGIIPMGTVAFADLPVSGMKNGWMYNISDDFTTDDRFNDGGGIFYGKGNNVIWTSEGKWDVTAGSGVTGIKGNKEKTYRQGNVNLTPEQIGALAEDGDTSDTTVAFASSDTPDADASAWTSVAALENGEKHASLFAKVSQMFKNVRYLYKMLGSTNISSIGGGTVTGAISSQNEALSQLNTNLTWKHLGDSAGTNVGGTANDITLPDEYNELLILVRPNSAYSQGDKRGLTVPFYLAKAYVDTLPNFELPYYCITGGHVYPPVTENKTCVAVKVSSTTISLDFASYGDVDTTASYYMSAYYR